MNCDNNKKKNLNVKNNSMKSLIDSLKFNKKINFIILKINF